MEKEKLVAIGVNYEEGKARFCGQAALYEKYLLKLFDDDTMEKLEQAMQQDNYEEAFKLAHNLKGTSGNLSVNKLYNKVCELVTAFRANEKAEILNMLFEQTREIYDEIEVVVRE